MIQFIVKKLVICLEGHEATTVYFGQEYLNKNVGLNKNMKFAKKIGTVLAEELVRLVALDELELDEIRSSDRIRMELNRHMLHNDPKSREAVSRLQALVRRKNNIGEEETFGQHSTGYLAYVLEPQSRQALLSHFKPKNHEVICEHITFKFPAKSSDDLPPEVRTAHVIGYAEEDGLEALVVEIDGHKLRPDGKRYHITLSLDRALNKKPMQSNALIAKGFKHINPILIHIKPKFLR